jgi:16S rRNA (cytosine967-C5)-methyltransferase
MTPGARVQAAIDLLDRIIVAAHDDGASADMLAKRFFAQRRYAGAKDRRAVRELTYQAIRRSGNRPVSGRAVMLGLAQDEPELAALFDGAPFAPPPIDPSEPIAPAALLPDWLKPKFADGIGEPVWAALLERAPLDIRLRDAAAQRAVQAEWPQALPLGLPLAMRLPAGTPLEAHPLYQSGAFEIQDLGSQAICAAMHGLQPERIIDLCAGAGGKTLAMAMMFPEADIIAADINRARLDQLQRRAHRSGARNIRICLLDPGRELAQLNDLGRRADLLLIDAPCSGTGTWRRNPELRWRLTPARLERVVATQTRLLDIGAQMTCRGGHLLYATCSLLAPEGAEQVATFLAKYPQWMATPIDLPLGRAYGSAMLCDPFHDGTDGFYFSMLRKAC